MTDDLDERDRRLLALLGADARMPVVRLATEVHLSPSAVRRRIERLERRGAIAGYTLRRNPARPGARALIEVRLTGRHCRVLAEAITNDSRVRIVLSVAGDLDTVVLADGEDLGDIDALVALIEALSVVVRATIRPVLDTLIDR